MPCEIVKLSNASSYPGNPPATIEISKQDANWVEAYGNWRIGKNPTDSPEWKKVLSLIRKKNARCATYYHARQIRTRTA